MLKSLEWANHSISVGCGIQEIKVGKSYQPLIIREITDYLKRKYRRLVREYKTGKKYNQNKNENSSDVQISSSVVTRDFIESNEIL